MKYSFLILFMSLATNVLAQKSLPSVTIKTLEGKSVNAVELGKKGKLTVVSFWATWCAPCKKELDAIKEYYPTWQKNYNVEIVAISIDNAQGLPKVKPTVAQKGWKYTILSDVNSQLTQSLGIQTIPHTLLVDASGRIIYEHSGYKPGDEIELENQIKANVK